MTGGQDSMGKENSGNLSTSPGQALLCPGLCCSHFYILWPALGGHTGRQGAGSFKEGSKELGVGFSAKQASEMKQISPRTHLYQIPRGYVPRMLNGGRPALRDRALCPACRTENLEAPSRTRARGVPWVPWLSEKGAETLQPHTANN